MRYFLTTLLGVCLTISCAKKKLHSGLNQTVTPVSDFAVQQIPSPAVFEKYAEVHPNGNRELKYFIVLDSVEGTPVKTFFIDSKKFVTHEEFLEDDLNIELIHSLGWLGKDYRELAVFSGARLGLAGALVWHREKGFYFEIYSAGANAFSFLEKDIKKHVSALSYAINYIKKDDIAFHAKKSQFRYLSSLTNSELDFQLYSDDDVKTSDREFYRRGIACGILKEYNKMSFEQALQAGTIEPNQIILMDHLPFELPVVKATITSVQQSKLSHIAVKAAQRNTPNMYTSKGSEISKIKRVLNKWVKLTVERSSFSIDPISANEAKSCQTKPEPVQIDTISHNYPSSVLLNIDSNTLDAGSKARNYAWLYENSKLFSEYGFHVRKSFGISGYWFQQYMKRHSLRPQIEFILANYEEKSTHEVSKSIQKLFEKNEFDAEFLTDLKREINKEFSALDSRSRIRFRSSSDVEDLVGFSAAGIYDSTWICKADFISKEERSQCFKKQEKKRRILQKVVRKVWSSYFSPRAIEERDYYGIPHMQGSMGILVHEAFDNEYANGVAVSSNLFSNNILIKSGVSIEILLGNQNVVSTDDPSILPESNFVYNKNVQVRLKSTTSKQKYILTDEQLIRLANGIEAIETKYLNDHSLSPDKYAVDIEFKVYEDESNIKFYLKQIRPYKFGY